MNGRPAENSGRNTRLAYKITTRIHHDGRQLTRRCARKNRACSKHARPQPAFLKQMADAHSLRRNRAPVKLSRRTASGSGHPAADIYAMFGAEGRSGFLLRQTEVCSGGGTRATGSERAGRGPETEHRLPGSRRALTPRDNRSCLILAAVRGSGAGGIARGLLRLCAKSSRLARIGRVYSRLAGIRGPFCPRSLTMVRKC